ncbi:hypothetical protein G9A89_018349 [Geosiphon pyriformis]|nr:hypothetical protein G9A89_018349 [Geosiphon pyriformis]
MHHNYYHPISHDSQRYMFATTKPQLPVLNPKSLLKPKSISTYLPANNTAANLSTTSISNSNLSAIVISNISTTATSNLSIPINSNTTIKSIIFHQPIFSSLAQQSGFCQQNSGTSHAQNLNSQNYLSLLVTSEGIPSNKPESNQKQPLTSNILPATISNNEFLAAIFPFKLEEIIPVLLFSRTILDTKPITTMYTNMKVDGYAIKLILDTTKTPISKIDDLPIEVNTLVGNNWLFKTNATLDWTTQKLQINQNSQHIHFKTTNMPAPLIKLEKKTAKKNCLPWELRSHQTKITEYKPITIASFVTANTMVTQKNKTSETMNHASLVTNNCSTKKYGITFLIEKEHVTLHASTQSLSMIG